MKSILIQLDEPTYRALNREAPSEKRKRSQFIREAIKKALHEAEFARMRKAYELQPDSGSEADDWSNAQEYKP